MNISIGKGKIELIQGDITAQAVDAIVNAANSRLAGGGGVDGAIHRAGGPDIINETQQRYPDGCPTGSAVISGAGKLPAKYVIHAVGPVYSGGDRSEAELLAGAYHASLELAAKHQCQSIAFPSISTGAYRYPWDEAARIALSTATEHLRQNELPQVVRFVLFSAEILDVFKEELERLTADGG